MKKHLKLIIALSITGVILIGAAITFVLAKDIIINKFMLMTKSEVGYFQWVAGREVDEACRKIEGSDQLKKAAEGLFPEKGSGVIRAYLKTHTAEAFTDMCKILPIKDMGLKTDIAFTDGSASISLSPEYDGNRLLTLNALYDSKENRLETELPDYKEGIIDLSSLLNMEVADGKKAADLINEYKNRLSEMIPDTSKVDPMDISSKYRRYAELLIDSIEDVELFTDSSVSINKEPVNCTEIRVSMKGREIRQQLEDLSDLVYEDYSDELNELSEKIGYDIKRGDFDKLIELINDDLSGKLILYVDNKANLIATDVKITYKATKLGAKIRWEETEKGISGTVGLSLNQINAVDIEFNFENDGDERTSALRILPDSFVDTFLGDYQGIELDIDHSSKQYEDTYKLTLKKQGSELASLTQEIIRENFSTHLLNRGTKTVYPIETITESDYLSVYDIGKLAITVLDRIGEPELEKRINAELEKQNLSGLTLDSLREMLEKDPEDIPAGWRFWDPNPYNLNDAGYPAYRVEHTGEYPEAGKAYYYSNLDLAEYATLGQYRGRTFKTPEPEEASPESIENAKTKYLENLENTILVDQNQAVVEWNDEVYLDILPYMYGVAIEAYHYRNSYARIGDEMYGEGLDEQIIGMKVGESKEITTTLGSQYGAFAGVEATFKVTVTKIARYVKPEWTEEFICGYMGFDSLDSCLEMLKEDLYEKVEVTDDEIMYTLVEEAKKETGYTDLPQELYYRVWNQYYNMIWDILPDKSITPEESFIEEGIDTRTFYSLMDDDVADKLKDYRFYAAIAAKEDIKLTGAELITVVNDYMEMLSCDTFEELMEMTSLQAIVDSEIEMKIKKLIFDSAVIIP